LLQLHILLLALQSRPRAKKNP